MSEAWGMISIRTTPELAVKFDNSENVPWEAMASLYEKAGLNIDEFISDRKDEPFFHEGIKVDNDLVVVSIFGDAWMEALKPIVTKGGGVEVYGKIEHEYGLTEYYILDAKDNHFIDDFDYESEEEKDQDEIIQKWKELIPEDIIKRSTLD